MRIKIHQIIGIMGLILCFTQCNSEKKIVMQTGIVDQQFYEYSGFESQEATIIKNEKDWRNAQNILYKNVSPTPKFETVIFEEYNIVVLAMGQKNYGGTFYKAKNYMQNGDQLDFLVTTPQRDPLAPATMAITNPVIICKIPATSADTASFKVEVE